VEAGIVRAHLFHNALRSGGRRTFSATISLHRASATPGAGLLWYRQELATRERLQTVVSPPRRHEFAVLANNCCATLNPSKEKNKSALSNHGLRWTMFFHHRHHPAQIATCPKLIWFSWTVFQLTLHVSLHCCRPPPHRQHRLESCSFFSPPPHQRT
jgi:hypothetical protein